MAQTNGSATSGQAASEQRQIIINPDDFSFDGSRISLFWTLLTARAGRLIKLNVMTVLFALPAIIAIFIYTLYNTALGATLPYSANFGPGYPGVQGVVEAGQLLVFSNHIRMFAFAAGGLVILCVGLAGAFYAMRPLARGEQIPAFKLFFYGIKKHALAFLVPTPLLVGLFFLTGVGFSGYALLAWPPALKIILLVLLCIACLFVLTVTFFYFTLTVTYEMPLGVRIKNSMSFTLRLVLRNVFILAVSALPCVALALLLPIQILNAVGLTLALMFLFSFIVLLWTVYAHWVFDRNFSSAPISVKTVKAEAVTETAGGLPASEKPEKPASAPAPAQNPKKTASSATSAPQHKPDAQKKSAAFKFNKKK